ncbi:toll/interleukin-1 receptor domain-containing protein [Aequorivita capsosiphonis]|uniref:toll/interleukin-1 receptor domain-containing protein n=1 Tax=Aequorivita capsosiphonis TaxID=487317 RepID=UPI0003FF9A6E|nr:toll/interleukin-1 receptor domain-containing protein [Aequorivita capsosiphonis]
MAGKRIFISYSRRDTEYVSSLVDALRKQGFEVWFDKNIRTGTDWDDTIESELKKADAVVLILSQTSVASENVKDEISYAIGLDKHVNPIKIEECEVPMRLARKQFVDFTTMGHEAGFERLVNDLKLTLKLAEENKSVPKGTFKPPVATTNVNSIPQKKSKKITPYIIGGIVSLVLFIFILIQCVDDEAPAVDANETNDISQTDEASLNPDWEDALDANSIEGYIKYMRNYGRDENYAQVLDSLDLLMPNEGMVLFWDASGKRYFTKTLYLDLEGKLTFGEDNLEMPRAGDLLSAISSQNIFSVLDRQILHGETIISGQKVLVTGVTNYADNSVWITVRYADQ